ncbi:glycosyltransferase [Marivita sp.]|uniref:glycosyltransferase n=1 Tax=Marivita sp. TaxID=2003365 RepID=UPI0025BF885F|nr:glycosyltransferase [Marivita sp.]
MTTVGILAHDLSDPAVARRVKMLKAGGGTVRVAGFIRGTVSKARLPLGCVLGLGRTRDGRLVQRGLSVLQVLSFRMGALKRYMQGCDVLIARNLEMLTIAALLARRLVPKPRLVYECLDIHRLLTEQSVAGRAIRRIEALAGRDVELVITSSPAFVENHLDKGVFAGRSLVVENKVTAFEDTAMVHAVHTFPGPPWRIGWFGNLRCRRSLDVLKELARIGGGEIEIILRGRPSPAIFPDLDRELAGLSHIRFEGPYDATRDLPRIYGEVHYSWCIDYYEEEGNSRWLLPNRLYESAFHNTVPIALQDNETGRFLSRIGAGVLLKDTSPDLLLEVFKTFQPEHYTEQIAQLEAVPRSTWATDVEECRTLVSALTVPSPATLRSISETGYGT